jgi:hypothetical protein
MKTSCWVVAALLFGACGTPDAAPGGEQYPASEAAEARDVEVSEIQEIGQQLDEVLSELRARTHELRLLPVNHVREQLPDHAARLERLDAVLGRQGEVLRADTAGFGHVAGIHEDEHRLAREELAVLRAEAVRLRDLDDAQLTERLGGHLDGVDRVLSVGERSAAHMRRVVDTRP